MNPAVKYSYENIKSTLENLDAKEKTAINNDSDNSEETKYF